MPPLSELSLDRRTLLAAYAAGTLSPVDVVDEVYRRIAAAGNDHVWLHLVPHVEARQRADALVRRHAGRPRPPLYGLPYGVKDNIDVAGLPTTAACAAIRRIPEVSATVVERLERVGAILIGKQNLDQFATGLVGIRNPAGYPRNAFDAGYIPGGSSSGSAVAVAKGQVSFSIGSDTGGSGRVPAALNNIVGLKATPGLVSNHGFLWNNLTFDVAPVFALTVDDAFTVLRSIAGHDPRDPFTVDRPSLPARLTGKKHTFRFAQPRQTQLDFFGDSQAAAAFDRSMDTLCRIGGIPVEIDCTPFLQAGELIFDSPFIVERALTYGEIARAHPATIHPAVAAALAAAERYRAEDVFRAIYRLATLQQETHSRLTAVDVLALPTAGTIYRCSEVEADPIRTNATLGRYTCFANPLRLAAVSVPAGLRGDGLPFGLQLLARPFGETALEAIARRFHGAVGGQLGVTSTQLNECG
mgnify:CR=1 FL=1